MGLNRGRALAGLDYALGQLGALPPPDRRHLRQVRPVPGWLHVELQVSEAGFSSEALEALEAALHPLEESALQAGAHDAGRLLMATLYQPWRYYQITGACAELDGWRALHPPLNAEYAVTVSQLDDNDRIVELASPPQRLPEGLALTISSGEGSLAEGTFEVEEVEVLDLMSNGQQRFAIYGPDGRLSPASDPELVPAGQPGRCMWCHEGRLQRGSAENPGGLSSLSYAEWIRAVEELDGAVAAWRASLSTSLSWSPYHRHTWAEQLTRHFLWASTNRVAAELEIAPGEVSEAMAGLGVGPGWDEEEPERGAVWPREAIDQLYLLYHPGAELLPVLPDDRELEEGQALEGEGEMPLRCEG
jgi:hypothetical protein